MASVGLIEAAELIRRRLNESIASKRELLDSDCVMQAAEVAARIVASLGAGG